MSIPVSTLTGANTINQMMSNVNSIKDLAANSASAVTGPASSTDNAIPRFDGTGGLTTQNSAIIIDDSNNITGVAGLTTTGTVVIATADINGGAIDGTVIGASAVAAGSFAAIAGTTGNFSGNVNLTGASPTLNIGSSAVSTGLAQVQVGTGRTGDGISQIDLVGDATYTDYGFRLIRNGGANGGSVLFHRGTGPLILEATDAAAIVFETTNAERMRITAAGDVGIGTSSVTTKLHVLENTSNGTINNLALLDAGNQNITVSGSGVSLDFVSASGATYFGGVGGYSDGTNYVAGLWGGAVASGAPGLSVNSSDQVGIGTTAPVTPLTIATTNKLGSTFTGNINGEGLTVTQTDYISGNYISLVEAAYDDGNDANPNVRIGAMFDGGGSNLAFGTSNSFGSGITNTALLINSLGNATFAGSVSGAAGNFSGNVNLTGAAPTLNVGSSAVSTGTLAIQVGNARTGDGYSYLDLVGDTTYSDYGLRLIRNGGANGGSVLFHRGTGSLIFEATDAAAIVFETTNTTRLTIASGGTATFAGAAIVTTNLDVYGVIQHGTNSIDIYNSDSMYLKAGYASSAITFSVGSGAPERMRITAAGKVGIGTTSPATTLDVNGDVSVEETLVAKKGMPIRVAGGNNVVLALSDNGKLLMCTNTASAMSVRIPNNSAVAFPIGAEISLVNVLTHATANTLGIAQTAGVILQSKEAANTIADRFTSATLKKTATNTWLLIGNLA